MTRIEAGRDGIGQPRRGQNNLEDRLSGVLIEGNANWVSMPEAAPVFGVKGYGPAPFLEGGDVLLVGRDIYEGAI